jgi:hypothetical protein
VDFGPPVALQLDLPRALDTGRNCCGVLGFAPVGQFAVLDRRHLDMDIDAVQLRAGDA